MKTLLNAMFYAPSVENGISRLTEYINFPESLPMPGEIIIFYERENDNRICFNVTIRVPGDENEISTEMEMAKRKD